MRVSFRIAQYFFLPLFFEASFSLLSPPSPPSPSGKKVAIIGGGIGGLVTAGIISSQCVNVDVTIFEVRPLFLREDDHTSDNISVKDESCPLALSCDQVLTSFKPYICRGTLRLLGVDAILILTP